MINDYSDKLPEHRHLKDKDLEALAKLETPNYLSGERATSLLQQLALWYKKKEKEVIPYMHSHIDDCEKCRTKYEDELEVSRLVNEMYKS